MKCQNCGAELTSNVAFCSECGAKIIRQEKFCRECGAELASGAKFCSNCGVKTEVIFEKESEKTMASDTTETSADPNTKRKKKTVEEATSDTTEKGVEFNEKITDKVSSLNDLIAKKAAAFEGKVGESLSCKKAKSVSKKVIIIVSAAFAVILLLTFLGGSNSPSSRNAESVGSTQISEQKKKLSMLLAWPIRMQ